MVRQGGCRPFENQETHATRPHATTHLYKPDHEKVLSDYTEDEFLDFVIAIGDRRLRSEEENVAMVLEFGRLTEHPDGADLITPGTTEKIAPRVLLKSLKNGVPLAAYPGTNQRN